MIIELLRKNIETCGKRRSVISRETGIDEAALSRIIHGGSCKAETIEILFKYFGYELRKKEGRKRK